MLKRQEHKGSVCHVIFSDGVFSYIDKCIVWHQWSNVETRPSWLSARLDHRQSRESAPGPQTRLDHAVGGSVPGCSEPQLLHQRIFLWGERRAPPRGGQRSVDQFTHFLPGSGESVGLPRLPASGCVLRTPCHFVHCVDGCQFIIRATSWKTTREVSAKAVSCPLELWVIIITWTFTFNILLLLDGWTAELL